MKRRQVILDHDYPQLLAMQRLSFSLNFPQRSFQESWFRSTLVSSARRGDVWVYEMDGEIVGWLWLDWSDAEAVHITHIQVAQAYWGQGIGRRVMEDAVREARERGRTAMTLNVTKANERAVRLYSHMGFVVLDDRGRRQFMRLDLEDAPPEGDGQ